MPRLHPKVIASTKPTAPRSLGAWLALTCFGATLALPEPAQSGLSATLLAAAGVQIAWPTNQTGYVLESAPDFRATDWTIVTNIPIAAGGQFSIRVPASGTQQFFRLRKAAPAGMALVPAGSFSMGDTFHEGTATELPVHTVFISSFYMDQHEVTKALWDEVYSWALNHGYNFDFTGSGKAPNHPVQNINWFDAVKWCNARSEMEGKAPAYYIDPDLTAPYRLGQLAPHINWKAGYRLPTEAEREKAARGGASGHRFPWSDTDEITHGRANYYSSAEYPYDTNRTREYHPTFRDGVPPVTSPVGSFSANGYGLFDMAGNVLEWCYDWADQSRDYYSTSPPADPRGPDAGTLRIMRGGSWSFKAYQCRASSRMVQYPGPEATNNNIGFRSVLPTDQ